MTDPLLTKFDPGLFEYEPKEVPDGEIWPILASLGKKPEDLPREEDRISYAAYLERVKGAGK